MSATRAESPPSTGGGARTEQLTIHGRQWHVTSAALKPGQLPDRGHRLLGQGELIDRPGGEKVGEFFASAYGIDVLVSSWPQSVDAGGDVPMDQVSFNFSKVEISYLRQGPTSALAEATTAGWDIKTNTKF